MSLSPLVFTGVSKFSEDFQTIVDRATRIAKLPVTALENQQKDLVQQKLLVGGLSGAVDGLAKAVARLGDVGKQKALVASSSDSTTVTAVNISSPAPARYTINHITSIATSAAESSLTGYADPESSAVSSTGTVKLVVGSGEYEIDLSGSNNLTSLRNKINALGLGVTASVLTTGTGATPYYLSLTANAPGATTLQLRDDPSGANVNLISATNQGANTEFDLNGVHISKNTSLINDVVPGVTFRILDTTSGSHSVSINVDSDRSQLETALQGFVANYNNVREQVNGQVGEAAGLLSGDFLVREVQGQLRKVSSYYDASGSVHSLAELGIEFNTNGVASFNTDAFRNLSTSQVAGALSFIGTASSGFGGLSEKLSQISDPVTGLAKIQLEQYDKTALRLSTQITDINARVSDIQKSVAARLQVMDTLLAGLQSQQGLLTASIDSLNYSTYGTKSSG